MAKVTAMQGPKKPTFNPQVNYKWEPTDVFEITGAQLASLYHCLTREVNDPQGASVVMKYDAFNTVMEVFKRGVEQGVIVETNPIVEDVQEVEDKVDSLFKGKRDPDSLPHWHPNS